MLRFLKKTGLRTGLLFVAATVLIAALLSLLPQSTGPASAWARFLDYLRIYATLDFDRTIQGNQPIGSALWLGLRQTLILVSGAVVFILSVAIPLGIARAMRPQNKPLRWTCNGLQTISATPVLVLATVVIVGVRRELGWMIGFQDLGTEGFVHTLLVVLVPAALLAVGDGLMADILGTTASETRAVLRKPYFVAVRARNVSVGRHLFRSLAGPLTVHVAGRISYLLSGCIVVEYLFNWQGLGFQIWTACTGSPIDAPFILAGSACFLGIVMVMHLAGQAVRAASDPNALLTQV